MDAVGSTLYGLSEGASMSLLFAATYPERTAALVVRSAFPRRCGRPTIRGTDVGAAADCENQLRVFGPRSPGFQGSRRLLKHRLP
jgi:pimeloyl-ACP methyl ester carboxylesterase